MGATRENPSTLARSAVLLGLLFGCASGPLAPVPPPAPAGAPEDPMGPPAWIRTLSAEPGPTLREREPVLPGAEGRVWAGVVSPEVDHKLAVRYCEGLLPYGGRPWRLPTLAELRAAPLERFAFAPGDWLWSATPAPGLPGLRRVLEPATGGAGTRALRQGLFLRVLCVSGEGS